MQLPGDRPRPVPFIDYLRYMNQFIDNVRKKVAAAIEVLQDIDKSPAEINAKLRMLETFLEAALVLREPRVKMHSRTLEEAFSLQWLRENCREQGPRFCKVINANYAVVRHLLDLIKHYDIVVDRIRKLDDLLAAGKDDRLQEEHDRLNDTIPHFAPDFAAVVNQFVERS